MKPKKLFLAGLSFIMATNMILGAKITNKLNEPIFKIETSLVERIAKIKVSVKDNLGIFSRSSLSESVIVSDDAKISVQKALRQKIYKNQTLEQFKAKKFKSDFESVFGNVDFNKNGLGYFVPPKTRYSRSKETVMIREHVEQENNDRGVDLLVLRKQVFEDFGYPIKFAVKFFFKKWMILTQIQDILKERGSKWEADYSNMHRICRNIAEYHSSKPQVCIFEIFGLKKIENFSLDKVKTHDISPNLETLVIIDRKLGAEYFKPMSSSNEIMLLTKETRGILQKYEEIVKEKYVKFSKFYIETIINHISVSSKNV